MKIVVVGAGLSGLLAARSLTAAGAEVVVFDKGRSPGGRLATRRIGGATFDHGAQFFTARSDRFRALVDGWVDAGVVYEWCRGFGPDADGYPRYAVRGGMNTLAKHLALGLDVRCSSMVFSLLPTGARWTVRLDDASEHPADAVILTCPTPQCLALMVTAAVHLPEFLRHNDYDRTLALLAVLDGPSGLALPGGLQDPNPAVRFVADNALKGVSAEPALTLHASPEWSLAHWEDPHQQAHAALVELTRPFLGDAGIVESQMKRWRFATPKAVHPESCWAAPNAAAPLVLAGDAFAGPRVEGAALSGLAAAETVLGH